MTTVRPATLDDIPAVVLLELDGFPGDAWTADYLRIAAEGGMPTVRLLVAESDGPDRTVVGHAIASIVFEVAELQRIAVGPAYRRRGHAQALLAAVIEQATAEGAERLVLEVRETNEPALAFYASAGFVEIDRRPRYYRDGTTGVVLELTLDQGR
ncbi:ribosomal-protein-alanine N-acetyltransferase [Nocardioides terrae]|uniref:Ribosomal-protein-alanine N-acetyltransferase n=1 Tax=Nocardioides terrae TaxID=574651 RepID=A0A1I1LEJ0_9ACTN|nr:GNAT family N-acetyltransferase [Nocardioides terrae]SFC71567.1 ribosomal-protein-alanine N-acetyltransferase [Nocardioides terrae]